MTETRRDATESDQVSDSPPDVLLADVEALAEQMGLLPAAEPERRRQVLHLYERAKPLAAIIANAPDRRYEDARLRLREVRRQFLAEFNLRDEGP